MATSPRSGNWLVLEELLERGDPAFVDELRRMTDAGALGEFAARWYADRRSASRRLLLEYLDRPLSAYRHEALVKRLFKLAEAAGDDQVMGRFLVVFDRSVRRVYARGRRTETHTSVRSREDAEALAAIWRQEKLGRVGIFQRFRNDFLVWRQWDEKVIRTSRTTTMPRGQTVPCYDIWTSRKRTTSDWVVRLKLDPARFHAGAPPTEELRAKLERFRLFSNATRNYLRRRAWRYFRILGKQRPARYVPAIVQALATYEDADVADGLALIDNWGLIHILFHHSPILSSRPRGWMLLEGRSLGELAAAPIYESLWEATPRPLFDLLVTARSRPVRHWAAQMIRRHQTPVLRTVALEEWLELLGHDDPELASLASAIVPELPGLENVSPERWLALAASANPAALEVLVELMRQHIRPHDVSFAQAVRLASVRSLPLATLGLDWLRTKSPRTDEEYLLVFGLAEADCEPLRGPLVGWGRGVLSAAPGFRPEWVVEYLDSRHADVRAEGWRWFLDEPRVRDDVDLWRRLLESPYDDVRLALVAELESRVAGRDPSRADRLSLDPELLRLLWASVLLNVHRGGRAKPHVIRQLLRRLETRPQELALLLPLLAVSLRSTRGPEWRAGLAALVQLVARNAAAEPLVRASFPELKWT